MATLLFSLRGVPEDEAYEIKCLLTEKAIDFYETSAGNWGVSMPALWLRNNQDLDEAQQLLEAYHRYRSAEQKEIYQQLKKAGEHKRLRDSFLRNPLQFILYMGFSAFILFVSVKILFEFGL
jgi:hypothetical protein